MKKPIKPIKPIKPKKCESPPKKEIQIYLVPVKNNGEIEILNFQKVEDFDSDLLFNYENSGDVFSDSELPIYIVNRFLEICNSINAKISFTQYGSGDLRFWFFMHDIPNPNYDVELKKYNNRFIEYDNLLKKYNNDLLKYQKDLLLYKEFQQNNKIIELRKKIEKLEKNEK